MHLLFVRFAFLLTPLLSFSQNLTGIWQGTVRQPGGEFSATFYITQTGDQLTGTSWSYLELRPEFSEKRFTAVKSGAAVSFQEEEILGENPVPGGPYWGLSFGNLQFGPEADRLAGELVFPKPGPLASIEAKPNTEFIKANIELRRK